MISWKKKQIPVLHLFIYKAMKEDSKSSFFIDYPSIKRLLNRRFYHIPKIYHHLFLKEMEELKLIKKEGNRSDIKYKFVGANAEKLLNKYTSFF